MRVRVCDDNCFAANYNAPNGQTYSLLTDTGIQPSGEIEDYALYLRSPYDLGDAPFDTDITGPADFAPGVTSVPGAVHTLVGSGVIQDEQPALMLGECWDSEESISVSPNLNADIDDTTEAPTSSNYLYYKYDNPNANCTSDEEGVQFPRYFTPGKQEVISFNYRVNSEDAMTVVWAIFADWDNDQDFSTAIDTGTISHTAADAQQNMERTHAVFVNVPTTAVYAYSYLRVRICIQDNTYTCTNATGRALGGEVEDYKINVQQSEYDYGDAPDADPTTTGRGDYETQSSNGASHQRVDLNFDSNIDLRLGSTWDNDDGTQQNPTATADGSDEDGVTFPGHGPVPTVAPGDVLDIDINIQTDPNAFTNDIYLYGWIDFNRDGDWDDAGEQIIDENSANGSLSIGTNTFPVQIPGNNVVLGYSFLRLRVCDSSACNNPNGEVNIGEVEDYRILFSNLISNFQNGIVANCNNVFQISKETPTSSSSRLDIIDLTSNPITQSALQNPISVAGQTSISDFYSLGYDRRTGYIYGTFKSLDTTNATNTLHLFRTDSSATSFIDLGPIYAESNMVIRLTSGQSITINQGDPFTYPTSAPQGRHPEAGAISNDYQYIYLWNKLWESIVKVDLSTQEMTVVDLSFTGFTSLEAASDLAVDFNNDVIYAVSLQFKRLYTINPNTGNVTAIPLDFPGMADPEIDDFGNLNPQGIFMDDMTHLYVFSEGGHHDSNNDNQRDLRNTSALYKINVHSGIATFEKSSSSSILNYSDIAGCYRSKDFSDGDSRYPIASHYYVDDSSGVGRSNLSLGSSVDTEIEAKTSSTAKGDDNYGLADEDLVVPATINVNEVTNMTFSLDARVNGYLNVWVDANHDYDFDDLDEHKLIDRSISSGATAINFNIIIDDSETNGYSGETTMRIRLCSSQNQCNSPSGEASSGEVEDHVFELLNRIIINGYVFEDNGVPSGVAHNGIKDSNEKGLKGFDVKIISNDSSIVGFPIGDTISTQTTRGDGYYEFSFDIDYSGKNLLLNVVPQEKWIDVSEADVSAINEVTNTSNQDSEMSVIATVGDILTGLNFGKVSMPVLTKSGFKEAEPGKTVSFPHRFKLETSADVTFLIDNDPRYPNTGWGFDLFEDTNCDGVLTPPGEWRMAVNVTYSGITDICLINRVFVASDAPLNRQLTYKISANVDLLGVNPPISRQVVVEDTTRVTYRGAGDLSLSLTVNNVLKNNTELLMNEAEPGDILEYSITYENTGTTPISDIVIYEYIQSPTKLYTPITCLYTGSNFLNSSNLNCTLDIPVNAENIADYQGEVQWTLSGTLNPGEGGVLTYQVIVD
ncbi:GEVED domain-containing protein [Photobacterium leiognathi]|nr:GEVED domain-containing protein [Photobacterium leiognathi]